MNPEERRLVLDRGFERALATVLTAFIGQGFTVKPAAAGDLRRPETAGDARRYATLDAALPELVFRAGATPPPPLFTCRVSMYELSPSCTLVTVENPIVRYPALATLVPRMSERVGHVFRALVRTATLNAA